MAPTPMQNEQPTEVIVPVYVCADLDDAIRSAVEEEREQIILLLRKELQFNYGRDAKWQEIEDVVTRIRARPILTQTPQPENRT